MYIGYNFLTSDFSTNTTGSWIFSLSTKSTKSLSMSVMDPFRLLFTTCWPSWVTVADSDLIV